MMKSVRREGFYLFLFQRMRREMRRLRREMRRLHREMRRLRREMRRLRREMRRLRREMRRWRRKTCVNCVVKYVDCVMNASIASRMRWLRLKLMHIQRDLCPHTLT